LDTSDSLLPVTGALARKSTLRFRVEIPRDVVYDD
jgi:hypothetical protein